jgi:hypothetical protein
VRNSSDSTRPVLPKIITDLKCDTPFFIRFFTLGNRRVLLYVINQKYLLLVSTDRHAKTRYSIKIKFNRNVMSEANKTTHSFLCLKISNNDSKEFVPKF